MQQALWELLVAGIGPLITIVLGTFWIGRFFRKRDREHNEEVRQAEERRQLDLRFDLVDRFTRAAAGLEMAIRLHEGEEGRSKTDKQRVVVLRSRMDDAYRECRSQGAALRCQLRAHFGDGEATKAWTQAEALLTVLYHRQIKLATDRLLQDCSV